MKKLVLKMCIEDGVSAPKYAHPGDAGLDLRIKESVTLAPGERANIGTGVSVEIPQGYVGLVFARSGLATKRGITLSNGVGVIDSGYRGEIGASLMNTSAETATLEANTRVCQLVVMPYAACVIEQVDELSDTVRGSNGFGSSGVA